MDARLGWVKEFGAGPADPVFHQVEFTAGSDQGERLAGSDFASGERLPFAEPPPLDHERTGGGEVGGHDAASAKCSGAPLKSGNRVTNSTTDFGLGLVP